MKTKPKKSTTTLMIIILILFVLIGFGYYKYKQEINKINEKIALELAEEKRIEELKPVKDIYLAINEEKEIDYIEKYDESIISVTKVNDKYIMKGLKVGFTNYYIPSKDIKEKVYVSNLYDLPHIDNQKELLPCHIYTEEQAHYLDRVLKYRIEEVGCKTRAGVTEAARFLSLRLKYKLDYFHENGRLNLTSGHPLADGEGRYYHEGLYLSDDKFEEIQFPAYGPAIWGCEIYEMPKHRMHQNGIDCSGYLTWALLNAGYDPDDIGGGENLYDDKFDLLDIGEDVLLKELDFTKLKAGDFIGYPGHIGIIIGINDKIYVAQAYWVNGLVVDEYTKEELIASKWKYVVLMDSYYKEDGNYTAMW